MQSDRSIDATRLTWSIALVGVIGFAAGCDSQSKSGETVASSESRQVGDAQYSASAGGSRGFVADSIAAAEYPHAMDRLIQAEADGSLPDPPPAGAPADTLRRFGAEWEARWGPDFEVKLVHARPLIEAGSPAPPWTLKDLDGQPVDRDEFAGRHLLMVWGSLSCPTTCYRIPAMEELVQEWSGAGLACVFVYEREAHADGQFGFGVVRQAFTFDDRARHARRLAAMFGLTWTILIDDTGNQTKRAYAAQDNSAYLIDPHGQTVLSQAFFEPEEVERELAGRLGAPASAVGDNSKRRADSPPHPEDL